MRLRLLFGYLLLVGAVIIIWLSVFRLFSGQGLLSIHIVGLVVGCIAGYFVAQNVWRSVEGFIAGRSEISAREAKELFGPPRYRWGLRIFMVYTILSLFLMPIEPSDVALSANVLINGVFSGSLFFYFFFLALRTIFTEIRLGKRLTITVN